MINTVNKILAVLTIASHNFILLGMIHILFFMKKIKKNLVDVFYKNGLKLAFLAAMVATLGSLFYSEVAGYEPCKLCWFQRIFMYPVVVLLGLAMIKKDSQFTFYPSVLAAVGAVISLFHNYQYFSGSTLHPFSACQMDCRTRAHAFWYWNLITSPSQ